jgi:hypothetical protein
MKQDEAAVGKSAKLAGLLPGDELADGGDQRLDVPSQRFEVHC